MPSPSEAANTSRATNVADIRAATPRGGVHSLPNAPDGSRDRLPAAEIFLIRRVVLDQYAAIELERHAGDHPWPVARQKQNGIGDILGLAHPAERNFARPHGFAFLRRDCPAEARRGRAGA